MLLICKKNKTKVLSTNNTETIHKNMKKINLHMISDSTGETILLVTQAAIAQFKDIKVRKYMWSLIRTEKRLNKVFSVISKRKGIVFFTFSDLELAERIRGFCKEKNILYVDLLKGVLDKLAFFLKQSPSPEPGGQHNIDKGYFERMDAINFTMSHDDGQYTDQILDADIILVGPSRTSKTPTSAYLAYKGFKTANMPYIPGIDIPIPVEKLKTVFVVGLSISPERLVEIRRHRLFSISKDKNTPYTDIGEVENEVREAKKFCSKNDWPVLDVTNKSVEEISARIVQMYYERKKKLKKSTLVAITGNLCSGKSLVLDLLKNKGYPVFNFDKETEFLLSKAPDVITEVKKAFPGSIKNKAINTSLLGDIVFFDKKSLKVLESILRPHLYHKHEKFIKNLGENKTAFFEVPLLFEKRSERRYDSIILLIASPETRKIRIKKRNISLEKAKKIMEMQVDPETVKDRADYVVDTNRGLADIKQDIDKIIKLLKK